MIINSAIIFCNSDISASIQATLVKQLYIVETITGVEFDARVAADPNYPSIVHLNNIKLLVLYKYPVVNNRNLANAIIFIKAGLAYLEDKVIGNHGEAFGVDKLSLSKLLGGNTKSYQFNRLCQCCGYFPCRRNICNK
jgi:hypothetical protein